MSACTLYIGDYNRTGLPHPHCEHGPSFGPYGEAVPNNSAQHLIFIDVSSASATHPSVSNQVNGRVCYPSEQDTPDWACRAKGITPANGSVYAACEMAGRGCTLGTYGGVFVGVLGRVITQTNVSAVLMVDALATDVFPAAGTAAPHPTFTLYNPHDAAVTVGFNHSARSMPAQLVATGYDLYDTVSGGFVARGCGGGSGHGHCGVEIGPDVAAVVVATPMDALVEEEERPAGDDGVRVRVKVGGEVVRW